ncbi:MAG: hypothetical protein N2D54_08590, partial [Chloroflexota bacterium]
IRRSPVEEAFERQHARAVGAQTSFNRVKEMHQQGLISEHAWEMLEPRMGRLVEVRTEEVREIMHADRAVEISQLNAAYLEGLRAQRSIYQDLLSNGVISDESYHFLANEVDTALATDNGNYGHLLLRRTSDQLVITNLLMADVQESDLQDTLTILNILGYPTTILETNKAEGLQPVHTLMIGVEKDQEDEVIDAIVGSSQHHTELKPAIFETLPLDFSSEIVKDNVAIYRLTVEQYEEF